MSDKILSLKIKKTSVLLSEGTDLIFLYPDIVSPFPTMDYPAVLKMETKPGYGAEYCQYILGISPEVIDVRPKK